MSTSAGGRDPSVPDFWGTRREPGRFVRSLPGARSGAVPVGVWAGWRPRGRRKRAM